MAESSQTQAFGTRRSRRWCSKKKETNFKNKLHQVKNDQAKNLKKCRKNDMSKIVCYNCEKKGHYAHFYNDIRKVTSKKKRQSKKHCLVLLMCKL